MIAFLKLIIGLPLLALGFLLILGAIFYMYSSKSRATSNKEYAEFVENLGNKKKEYSRTKKPLRITAFNAGNFVDGALAKAEQQDKSFMNNQKQRSKRNKLKRNRKRSKIAKASRKQNR
jgi:hypothetical protein